MASAVVAHMAWASARPGAPVAALALPELRITAAAWPRVRSRCDWLVSTGAAVILLSVNTPAAGTALPSAVATSDRSGSPDALIPQATPAATNPLAAVTLMWRWLRSWVQARQG